MSRAPSRIYLADQDIEAYGVTVNGTVQSRNRKKLPFGWYGGKFNHLDWLLPLLPSAHHYCEPYGGSGAVLLNRTPAAIETYNDIDGEVVNFFRVLREERDELVAKIALTPFAREEYFLSLCEQPENVTPVERALRFFIRARQTRTGLAQTATLGRWANCRNTSRSGMSGVISRWLGSVEGLPEIATRLLRVQIENRPALDVIALYDDADTLFYCDPPYPHGSRGDSRAYGHEMSDAEHIELSSILNQVKGKVALSGYQCDLLDRLYSGWRLHLSPPKKAHSMKQLRQEALWTNF